MPQKTPQTLTPMQLRAGDTASSRRACGEQSFTAGTKVLLASGAAIPISQLKPDDEVLATNVKTGKTSAEPVRAMLVHHDTDRYKMWDLSVPAGKPSGRGG